MGGGAEYVLNGRNGYPSLRFILHLVRTLYYLPYNLNVVPRRSNNECVLTDTLSIYDWK